MPEILSIRKEDVDQTDFVVFGYLFNQHKYRFSGMEVSYLIKELAETDIAIYKMFIDEDKHPEMKGKKIFVLVDTSDENDPKVFARSIPVDYDDVTRVEKQNDWLYRQFFSSEINNQLIAWRD